MISENLGSSGAPTTAILISFGRCAAAGVAAARTQAANSAGVRTAKLQNAHSRALRARAKLFPPMEVVTHNPKSQIQNSLNDPVRSRQHVGRNGLTILDF